MPAQSGAMLRRASEWLIETFGDRDANEQAALACAEWAGSYVVEARKTPSGRLTRSIMA